MYPRLFSVKNITFFNLNLIFNLNSANCVLCKFGNKKDCDICSAGFMIAPNQLDCKPNCNGKYLTLSNYYKILIIEKPCNTCVVGDPNKCAICETNYLLNPTT